MKNLNKAFSEAASEIHDNSTEKADSLERFIHDEENGLDYELMGDYYLPCLTPSESPKISAFGKAHFHYLRTEKKVVFDSMMLSGKLNAYLEDIDRQAEAMFNKLVKDMAGKEGVTEQLKANNQTLWVQKMNLIRNRATEIVNAELIYN